MIRHNNLAVEFFEPFSTTRLKIPEDWQRDVAVVFIETNYPGGIYGAAEINVPYDLFHKGLLMGAYAYRVVIRNGHTLVYEGHIDAQNMYAGQTSSGVRLLVTGNWGMVCGNRGLRRWFSDNRTSDDPWLFSTIPAKENRINISRQNNNGRVLAFTPSSGAQFAAGNSHILHYTAPAGETIQRITFDYILSSQSDEDWTLQLYDVTNAVSLWSVSRTTTGNSTGSQAISLSPTSSQLQLRFISDVAQTVTPTSDGTTSYAQVANIIVYAETANPDKYADTAYKIIVDIANKFSSYINTSENGMSTNTQSIVPFLTGRSTGGFEYLDSLLSRAAAFGDANFNPWAVGFLDSERVSSPNGKPLFYYEPVPTSGYDYQIHVGQDVQASEIDFDAAYYEVRNRIWVSYNDENGNTNWLDPDSTTTLKNVSSGERYSERDHVISLGNCTAALAQNIGRMILAQYQYNPAILQKPLVVHGSIQNAKGQPVPASEIRAGRRIRITNFLGYFGEIADQALTFLITGTRYNDADQSCTITTGRPTNRADVLLAQMEIANT